MVLGKVSVCILLFNNLASMHVYLWFIINAEYSSEYFRLFRILNQANKEMENGPAYAVYI